MCTSARHDPAAMTTPCPDREIRYQMTAADYAEWSNLSAVSPPSAGLGADVWYWLSWLNLCLAIGAWALLAAMGAEAILGREWRNGAFLATFAALALMFAYRGVDEASASFPPFALSVFVSNPTTIRLEPEAIVGVVGGIAITISWGAVHDVRQGHTIALVTYDRSGAGLCIVPHAFPDGAAMEDFLSDIERRCLAARSADTGETES